MKHLIAGVLALQLVGLPNIPSCGDKKEDKKPPVKVEEPIPDPKPVTEPEPKPEPEPELKPDPAKEKPVLTSKGVRLKSDPVSGVVPRKLFREIDGKVTVVNVAETPVFGLGAEEGLEIKALLEACDKISLGGKDNGILLKPQGDKPLLHSLEDFISYCVENNINLYLIDPTQTYAIGKMPDVHWVVRCVDGE